MFLKKANIHKAVRDVIFMRPLVCRYVYRNYKIEDSCLHVRVLLSNTFITHNVITKNIEKCQFFYAIGPDAF